jgi:hypothetical protein
VLGEERAEAIRSGRLSREALREQLCRDHHVKASAANKAIVGFYVLAAAAGESAICRVLGRTGLQSHVPHYEIKPLELAKDEILSKFGLFAGQTGGIDGWLNAKTPDITFEWLSQIPVNPLTGEQLNELLTLGHAPPLSRGFFRYYWLSEPDHPYDLAALPCYSDAWAESSAIFHLDQLYWGLYRFYLDALLFFGNVRSAYQVLRSKNYEQLSQFFNDHWFPTMQMVARGLSLPLRDIKKDDRYLISEMACKSYAPSENDGIDLETALREACRDHFETDPTPITLRALLGAEGDYVSRTYPDKQGMFKFAADEILDQWIASESDLDAVIKPVKERFRIAHDAAVINTERYLSSVGELDAYVATSMRTRDDFHAMADFCARVFRSGRMHRYNLRYFDPTMSAASNHEDKGLIECLMVKCCKVLVYTAGELDSYGKAAEAAMALSLGKPVIFFCEKSARENFYKNVHPLSRLVDFQTGVAVGAIVTDNEQEVIELLERLFTNKMQYVLEEKKSGYLVLKEKLTDSVIRLQTNDELLRETFWNHYFGNRFEAN